MRKRRTRKAIRNRHSVDSLPEYDFSRGVRGKYAKRYAESTNLVKLDPDVARRFSSSRAVNQALRSVIQQDTK